MINETKWYELESDPAVLTELLELYGIKGLIVDEALALDASLIPADTLGLMFLFDWNKLRVSTDTLSDDPSLFFARQTSKNSCATHALLHILLNCADAPLSRELMTIREFCRDLDPASRGEVIGNHEALRDAHNSFIPRSLIEFVEQEDEASMSGKRKAEESYHYVAYVYHNNAVYLLDGLQDSAYCVGPCDRSDWVAKSIEHILESVNKLDGSSVGFSLLRIGSEVSEILTSEDLADIRLAQKRDNSRRRHDYLPAICCLLEELARARKLSHMFAALASSSS